ncbi:MAG: type II toxin-antitoxin system HicB family antitoxin [Lentimicrobium sp.]|jgi:predicted RNase H-like HicB family nuclease|nr:type II toxin-antitoxin system HicB family antitoxin [Lentimicrobium sp.]
MQKTYKILMHKEPEGSYTVSVPALPGYVTYGDTVEHAILMAREAMPKPFEKVFSKKHLKSSY